MISAPARPKIPAHIRYATLLVPPVGLWLLWRHREISVGKKLLRTAGILLYLCVYTGLIVGVCHQFFGLKIEWRGGYLPSFTWSPTLADFTKLSAHRQGQGRATAVTNAPATALPGAWPGFRGPLRDGHYDEQPILTQWPATGPKLLWRQPCGGGYGSFAIAGPMVYSLEQRQNQETLVAYEFETGRELWTHAYDSTFRESMGGDGPRATPTYDDGLIYSQGGLGELRCLEAATGKPVWRKNILVDNSSWLLYYGMASSPLAVDDKLIVQAGSTNQPASVAAYDKKTGVPLWSVLSDPGSYSSPMVVTLAGQRQLLVVTATRAVGLTLESGRLLWEIPWVVAMKNRNIAQPVLLATNRFFLSAGYGTGGAAVEVSKAGSSFSARELWRNKSLKNKFSSSVFWEGCLYGLDEDILTCVDAGTGGRRWKDGRYGYGQVLLAGGYLVILTGEGQVALVKATPKKYAELGRFQAIAGKTWNYPALAQGRLLVRNALEMACFDISVEKLPATRREAD